MSRDRGSKSHPSEQMVEGGGCNKPLCQASTLIELTFMEAMEKIMDSKFGKLEDRLNDIEEKNDKILRMVSSDEYGRAGNMPLGKMDQRLTTLEETLDSVSESVIDKLIPAVIKMQKDVKTIRKDIDATTKQHGDDNMRLSQTIHKMQDRLDETFLRASDTKQMGKEIIKNTQDLLRESNKVEGVMNDPHGLSRSQEMSPHSEGRALPRQRSPGESMPRPRSPSCEAERNFRDEAQHYDAEEILRGSIKREKRPESNAVRNSTMSARDLPNGERFDKEEEIRKSPEGKPKSPDNRKPESPVRNSPERQRRPRTPNEAPPRERPPSPDSIRRHPASPDRKNERPRTPSQERRLHSAERLGRTKREYSPMVLRYPSPPNDNRRRQRSPLSPGKVYTDKQESTEENGVFIDKFGEEKHWTRWTYGEPNIKRAKGIDSTEDEDKLAAARRITVTVRRTPSGSGSPKRVRRESSSSEEGIVH